MLSHICSENGLTLWAGWVLSAASRHGSLARRMDRQCHGKALEVPAAIYTLTLPSEELFSVALVSFSQCDSHAPPFKTQKTER